MARPDFPIDTLLPQVLDSLAAHPRLLLEAPPGAGKTTQVPLALLDAPWLAGRKIVMLEPRRVAARAAAAFMAAQLGEPVGERVGYRIRFDNKVSARTRVEVVTEGILTRMLQDDPSLEGVGALLFDEFHERHLAGDLGLALALDVQAQLRQDLRIVLMSATLDGERLAQFMDAPRLCSAGRSHPVAIAHFQTKHNESLTAQTRRAVEHALAAHPGDVLVFLPGRREIGQVRASLEMAGIGTQAHRSAADGEEPNKNIELQVLHGELPVEQQSRVLQPAPNGRRRVVLATNVAESSLTLPGVRVVIDAGLAREPRYDPNSGFSRLQTVQVSQTSADQRAGRAGRIATGWAYRLWPQSLRLEPQRRPEIAQVELTGLALELAVWGSDALRFVDPPPPGALAAARDLLHRLGALHKHPRVTPDITTEEQATLWTATAEGRAMLALGMHPRLAAMLLAPTDPQGRALACDLAALIEGRDPLRARAGAGQSDAVAERWQALAAFRSGRVPDHADRTRLAEIDAATRQWRRRLGISALPPAQTAAHDLGDLLLHAFPDRIGYRHAQDGHRYQLANGRMARLFDDSALHGEPWLVASELRFEARDALLLRGAPLDPARLQRDFPQRFVEQDVLRWDRHKGALVAQRERRFDAIVLDVRPAGRVDPAQAAQALTDAVREAGLDALPWSDALTQWRTRVQCLRAWLPALKLPDLSDTALIATLDGWLRPAFAGKTRLDALRSEDLKHAMQALCDRDMRQHIDRFAPALVQVPSGMQRPIVYALDDDGQPSAPVLAVKLQELFGLADTPRIAQGRVPLTLHLLSPAGRPLQVTQDLRGFWERTWPQVRKEMKGRYPKHPWPEDPWSATATHRAKPRGS